MVSAGAVSCARRSPIGTGSPEAVPHRVDSNPSLTMPNEPGACSRPSDPCARTNPNRARKPNETRACRDQRNPRRAAGAPSLAEPNEPEPRRTDEPTVARSKRTRPRTARPRPRVRAPCRRHGLPRSHGPREQKVNGEWLTRGYRPPEIGSIRDGASEDERRAVTKPERTRACRDQRNPRRAAGLQARADGQTRAHNDCQTHPRRAAGTRASPPNEPEPHRAECTRRPASGPMSRFYRTNPTRVAAS
jgi:hypothetical protein